jgi:hypothetical protein
MLLFLGRGKVAYLKPLNRTFQLKQNIVSQHDNVNQATSRINLKWQGNHDIADFNLERLGKVVSCETETENTGWVIIERSRLVKIGCTILC